MTTTRSWRAALTGTPADWMPRLGQPLRRAHPWGPVVVLVTLGVSAVPFNGIDGDGVGLGVGTLSIVAMAWTFVLAVRSRWSEALFGGLDQVYVAHRWLGMLAVVLMWWHVQAGNQMDSGAVAGASESLAETGTDLGGIAETWVYILVVASIVRLLPYRIWRWTHKLLGIPFAFASFHMITAEKPFANLSPWGLWFVVVIAVGVAAFVLRVLGRDALFQGSRYTVSAVVPHARSVEVRMRPDVRPITRRAGQFVFLRMLAPGASEPHPFSVASAPDDPELTVMIRELGDWTNGVGDTVRVGDAVRVEGPYGRLRVRPKDARQTVWVAGGVGITPFLSSLGESLEGHPAPVLLYAVRDRSEAHAHELIEEAARSGRVEVHWFESARGTRLTAEAMAKAVGERMRGAHVAVCGPTDMIRWVRREARTLGAADVESEQFDFRGGIGPDPSRGLLPRLRRKR